MWGNNPLPPAVTGLLAPCDWPTRRGLQPQACCTLRGVAVPGIFEQAAAGSEVWITGGSSGRLTPKDQQSYSGLTDATPCWAGSSGLWAPSFPLLPAILTGSGTEETPADLTRGQWVRWVSHFPASILSANTVYAPDIYSPWVCFWFAGMGLLAVLDCRVRSKHFLLLGCSDVCTIIQATTTYLKDYYRRKIIVPSASIFP